MPRSTQKEMVLSYLQEWGSITQLDAIRDLGVFRLASRINELRDDYGIKTTMEPVRTRYGTTTNIARYTLATPPTNENNQP